MTAAGLIVGILLALALLALELTGILGAPPGRLRSALRIGVWAGAAAFAILTVVRLLQFAS